MSLHSSIKDETHCYNITVHWDDKIAQILFGKWKSKNSVLE